MLDTAHPKRGDTLQLPLMADFTTDPVDAQKQDDDGPKQGSLFDQTDPAGWDPLLKAAAELAWKDEDSEQ